MLSWRCNGPFPSTGNTQLSNLPALARRLRLLRLVMLSGWGRVPKDAYRAAPKCGHVRPPQRAPRAPRLPPQARHFGPCEGLVVHCSSLPDPCCPQNGLKKFCRPGPGDPPRPSRQAVPLPAGTLIDLKLDLSVHTQKAHPSPRLVDISIAILDECFLLAWKFASKARSHASPRGREASASSCGSSPACMEPKTRQREIRLQKLKVHGRLSRRLFIDEPVCSLSSSEVADV